MPKTDPRRYSDRARHTRTRAETARIIGCSINAVDPLLEKGDLVAVTVGNRRLITTASIEKLLGVPIEKIADRERPSMEALATAS